MGLAISAASLSTLRPLAKAVGWKFGIGSQHTDPRTQYVGGNNGAARYERRSKLGHVYIRSEFKQDADGSEGTSRWAIGTLSTAYANNGKTTGSGSGSFERLEITTSEREAEEGYAKNVSPKYFLY
jgi:hypothetical protein